MINLQFKYYKYYNIVKIVFKGYSFAMKLF